MTNDKTCKSFTNELAYHDDEVEDNEIDSSPTRHNSSVSLLCKNITMSINNTTIQLLNINQHTIFAC